jgi:hypothetical protein
VRRLVPIPFFDPPPGFVSHILNNPLSVKRGLVNVRFAPKAIEVLRCRELTKQTLIRGAYLSSSTPRIIGTHVPPIWVAVTLPALLSALAMSRLGRPISMP